MAAPMGGRIQNKTRHLLLSILRNSRASTTCQWQPVMRYSKGTSSGTGEGSKPVPSHVLRSNGRKIAYNSLAGRTPGVVFCPGFQSNMGGTKALELEKYCQHKGHAFIRFDYQGCGQSEGDIRDVTFSDWKSDVLAVLDDLTEGPQILVGSSMGAWLAVLAAVSRPDRLHALIGIASAPDFSLRTEQSFSPAAREELKQTGETQLGSEYGSYVITQRFLDDLPQHRILGGPLLTVPCPVRLLHGMADRSVPFELSIRLSEQLATPDVSVLLRKAGDHRLSEPQDLKILIEQLNDLLQQPKVSTAIKL